MQYIKLGLRHGVDRGITNIQDVIAWHGAEDWTLGKTR